MRNNEKSEMFKIRGEILLHIYSLREIKQKGKFLNSLFFLQSLYRAFFVIHSAIHKLVNYFVFETAINNNRQFRHFL